MSRVGNYPVEFPESVEVKIEDNLVSVKGPKGELAQKVDDILNIELNDNNLVISRPDDSKHSKSMHGLYRTLVLNMIEGVTNGYEKTLLIEGTGYRADKAGDTLNLHLGFSHDIALVDPEGIETEVPDQTTIIVRGIDKQLVGNYSANIRSFREPEPYKGKGIRYKDEQIRRKVGKTGS